MRAFAVLSVVLWHTVKHSPVPYTTTLSKLASFGAHGVELFFVISGVCLAFPFLRRYHADGALGFKATMFFTRRMVRILPPYYVAVCLFALLSLTSIWQLAATAYNGHAMTAHVSPAAFIAHFAFMARDFDLLNTSFWTLRIEALWYLLFPLLLVAYVRKRGVFFVFGAACALAAILHVFRDPFGTVDKMTLALPAFMLGIVAADMHLRRISPTVILGVLFVTSGVVGVVEDLEWTPWSRLAWDACAFSFVVLAGSQPWLARALTVRALTMIGIASYSIYLMHEPVLNLLEYLGVPAPAAAAAAIGAGALFWLFIERPLTAEPLRSRLYVIVQWFLDRVALRIARFPTRASFRQRAAFPAADESTGG